MKICVSENENYQYGQYKKQKSQKQNSFQA